MNLFTRVFNFLNTEDKAVNALGGGKPTQTISGTCGRAYAQGRWWAVYIAVPIINTIFFWQPNHCQTAAAIEAKA